MVKLIRQCKNFQTAYAHSFSNGYCCTWCSHSYQVVHVVDCVLQKGWKSKRKGRINIIWTVNFWFVTWLVPKHSFFLNKKLRSEWVDSGLQIAKETLRGFCCWAFLFLFLCAACYPYKKWIKRCWKKLWIWNLGRGGIKVVKWQWISHFYTKKEGRGEGNLEEADEQNSVTVKRGAGMFSMMLTSARSQMSKKWSNISHSPNLMMTVYFLSSGVKQSNLWAIGYPWGVKINCIPSISQSFSPFQWIMFRYYSGLSAATFSDGDRCQ